MGAERTVGMTHRCHSHYRNWRGAVGWLGGAGALLCATAASMAATGPDFDCARAKGPVQEQVCTDGQLASLDRETARLYTLAANSPRLSTKNRARLRAQQYGWITRRNNCSTAADLRACVLDSYVSRIYELRRDFEEARSADADGISSGPVEFTCEGAEGLMAATFIHSDPALASLATPGRLYTLTQVPAASGARYAATTGTGKGDVSFWTHGDDARLEMPGAPVMNCKIAVLH